MNQRLRRSPPDVVYTPIDVTSPKRRIGRRAIPRVLQVCLRSRATLLKYLTPCAGFSRCFPESRFGPDAAPIPHPGGGDEGLEAGLPSSTNQPGPPDWGSPSSIATHYVNVVLPHCMTESPPQILPPTPRRGKKTPCAVSFSSRNLHIGLLNLVLRFIKGGQTSFPTRPPQEGNDRGFSPTTTVRAAGG